MYIVQPYYVHVQCTLYIVALHIIYTGIPCTMYVLVLPVCTSVLVYVLIYIYRYIYSLIEKISGIPCGISPMSVFFYFFFLIFVMHRCIIYIDDLCVHIYIYIYTQYKVHSIYIHRTSTLQYIVQVQGTLYLVPCTLYLVQGT